MNDFFLTTLDSFSSLTDILPFVSKKFRLLCRSDFFWKMAMQRFVKNELWEEGLHLLILDQSKDHLGMLNGKQIIKEIKANLQNEESDAYELKLVEIASKCLHESDRNCQSPSSDFGPCKALYKNVLSRNIRYTSPLFHMPGNIILGEAFEIYFFEPRYRRLIAEVMDPYPSKYSHGVPIPTDNDIASPKFIYAHCAPLQKGALACIVQVLQCLINPDGTASVMLEPVSHVNIESVWVRSREGLRLFEARSIKMGFDESMEIEEPYIM